jgi:glutaredoxin
MKKGSAVTTIIILIVLVAIGIIVGIYLSKNKSGNSNTNTTSEENQNGSVAGASTETREIVSTPEADIIIFYGSTCPHCKKVNEYIIANNIDKIVKLQHLEVYNNQSNLDLMKQKLEQCKNLSEDDKGGVPFMYSSTKCLVGDQPIIDYLKELANQPAS